MNMLRSAGAMLMGVPVIALLAFGFTRDPGEVPSGLPGTPAPPFALEMFARGSAAAPPGDTFRLADQYGQVVVLNFWASWCLACRSEHDALTRVANVMADSGVTFVGVLHKDTPENGRAWIAEMGGQPYVSVMDPGSRTAIDYGLYGVPETFVIRRDGRVTYKHVGPITEDVLQREIALARLGTAKVLR